MLILGWLFFSVAAAMFAHIHRNRNGGGWFFVALFFSPLVAFVLLLILRPVSDSIALRQDNYTERSYQIAAIGSKAVPIGAAIFSALIIAMLIAVVVAANAGEQQMPSQQVFRDASGRTTMTATQSGNQTTYRDESGRTIGTSAIGSSGQQHNIRKAR
jgi:hypothetical protein